MVNNWSFDMSKEQQVSNETLAKLAEFGIQVVRHTQYHWQIKSGEYIANLYPTTLRVYHDPKKPGQCPIGQDEFRQLKGSVEQFCLELHRVNSRG